MATLRLLLKASTIQEIQEENEDREQRASALGPTRDLTTIVLLALATGKSMGWSTNANSEINAGTMHVTATTQRLLGENADGVGVRVA